MSRHKSQDVRAATWIVSSMVERSGEKVEERLTSVLLKRRGGRVKV